MRLTLGTLAELTREFSATREQRLVSVGGDRAKEGF